MLSRTKVYTENVHVLPSVGALVQVMLLCVVLVGQLPQFDAVRLLHSKTVTDKQTPLEY